MAWGVFWNPMGFDFKTVMGRAKAGVVHGGAALCGKLLRALIDRDVAIFTDTPGVRLVMEGGRATGLVVTHEGAEKTLRARGGVILASGGFEWSETYRKAFLPLELTHPVSPPHNTGDALRMAMAAGADLGNMGEAWWTPALAIPGETYDGAPLYRAEFSVRCLPHSILVNRAGQRFTNEAHNYNDMTKPYFTHDPVAYEQRNAPAWLVVDQQYLDKYVLVTAMKGRPIPEWITEAPTLAELAAVIDVDAAGLAETVARFNEHARSGVDADFRRGESAFDRFYGDPRMAEVTGNASLGTIERGPFYAFPLHAGAMGTKGGPKHDEHGRVLHAEGGAIEGLYAVGNAAASVMGPGYPGAGATIGVSMTFGYAAAKHASERVRAAAECRREVGGMSETDEPTTIPGDGKNAPNARAAILVVALLGIVPIALFGAMGSCSGETTGQVAVSGGPHGDFTLVPTDCHSMQPFGRMGANVHGERAQRRRGLREHGSDRGAARGRRGAGELPELGRHGLHRVPAPTRRVLHVPGAGLVYRDHRERRAAGEGEPPRGLRARGWDPRGGGADLRRVLTGRRGAHRRLAS